MAFGSKTEYNAAYADMRGVDFTSDESQVSNNRFAYLKNMYKNYRSENGGAVETIPGFREIHTFGSAVGGLHGFYHLKLADGRSVFFIHISSNIFGFAQLTDEERKTFEGDVSGILISFEGEHYRMGNIAGAVTPVNSSESTAVQIGEFLYIVDGAHLIKCGFDTEKLALIFEYVEENVYIPTTYKAVPPTGYIKSDDDSYGYEYEQRNLLSPLFKVESLVAFKETEGAEGTATPEVIRKFVLPERYDEIKEVIAIKADGTSSEGKIQHTEAEDGSIEINDSEGFSLADYERVVFTLNRPIKNIKGAGLAEDDERDASVFVLGCTKACVFDNRIFLSGNPLCPNHVFFCGFDSATAMIDPSYFGILDNFYDGLSGKITGIMAVSNTLCVLKNDDIDGNIYFHSPQETGENLAVKTYPSVRGITSVGCLSGCVNFLDDPVYISSLGLEGISALTAGSERIVEHRSSNVDSKLLECDLTKAQLGEFEGYLFLLCEGKIFLADSRQRFTHSTGVMQYEWYYLENIGMHINITDPVTGNVTDPVTDLYVYKNYGDDYEGVGDVINAPPELWGSGVRGDVKPKDEDGNLLYSYSEERDIYGIPYKYFCDKVQTGAKMGGTFDPAVRMVCTDKTVYFITKNLSFCAFNFDKRKSNGDLDYKWYSFAGHIIKSGCAFKLDNVGIPHLVKTTVKKSTVVKTKVMSRSRAKVKVRTNRSPYHSIGIFSAKKFDFNDIDFSDFSFLDGEKNIFLIREKEKKWIEKQYYIYSDEYQKPFGIYNLAFRYFISGRYKG